MGKAAQGRSDAIGWLALAGFGGCARSAQARCLSEHQARFTRVRISILCRMLGVLACACQRFGSPISSPAGSRYTVGKAV
jgi:hypothetical protein